MADFNLDSFLAAQQAEGTSHGQGGFTISHEKAAQKRSQYTLIREQSWVLKIVQAAMAWNCSELIVQQSRTTSTFKLLMHDTSSLPDLEELVQSLLLADFENPDPKHCLATALRVVVERAHASFLLSIDKETTEAQALYAGVHFGEMSEEARKRLRENWVPGLTLAIHHIPHTETNRLLLNLIPYKAYGFPMMTELVSYAYVSPIPITLDGRRIDGVFQSPTLGWSSRHKPLLVRGLYAGESEMPVVHMPQDCFNREFTMRSSRPRGLSPNDESKAYKAILLLSGQVSFPSDPNQTSPESRLIWVKNGVVVYEEDLYIRVAHLGLRLFANAEGLETDLTGFQLIQNDEYLLRKKAIYESAAEIIKRQLHEPKNPIAHDPNFAPQYASYSPQLSGTGLLSVLRQRIDESLKFESIESRLIELRRVYESELTKILYELQVFERKEAEEEDRLREQMREREAEAREQEARELRMAREAEAWQEQLREKEALEAEVQEYRQNLKAVEAPPKTEPNSAKETVKIKPSVRPSQPGVNPEWLAKIRQKSEKRAAREAAEKAGKIYESQDLRKRDFL